MVREVVKVGGRERFLEEIDMCLLGKEGCGGVTENCP